MRAIEIHPSGAVAVTDDDWGNYDKPSGFVGGFIEILPFPGEAHCYINEEGKVKGLPLNHSATMLGHAVIGIALDDFIAGPMVILGSDPEGDEASVPQAAIDTVNSVLGTSLE